MIIHKTIILTILFFVNCFPVIPKNNTADSNLPQSISADTLYFRIIKDGWNKTTLDDYRNYLINTTNDLNTELDKLNNFSNSFETEYLKSIILKKQGKFNKVFVSLFNLLVQNPDYIPYYDDLIYSAFVSKNEKSLINNILAQGNLSPFYNNYIIAMIDYKIGNYSQTLKTLNNLIKEKPGNKYLLYHLSYTYRNVGNYVEALNLINKAISNNDADNYFLCDAYLAIGSLHYLSGKYSSAQNYYLKANNLSKSIKNKYSEATSLVDLGIIEDQNGNIEKAREYYHKAISITESHSFLELSALAYSELGVSYSFTSELLKAKANYLKSYELYKRLGNYLRLSLLSDNIAKLYLYQFNYTEAMKLYEEGLDFAGENKRAKAINLIGLADIYANLSNYSKALDYYNKAKIITTQIKAINLEVEIKNGLGSLNLNLNNNKSAFEQFKSANDLSVQSGDPYSIAESYHNLGLAYSRMDSTDEAESNYKLAIEISSKYSDQYTHVLSLVDLAYLYIQTNNIASAYNLLEQAKRISRKNDFTYLFEAASVLNGKIYAIKNDLLKAESVYKNSLKNIKMLNEPNIEIEIHYLLAGVYARNKKYESAEVEYRTAIGIIEKISKSLYTKDQVQISYFSAKDEVYNSYIELLLSEKKFKEAFLIIDRSRSRNTFQNLFNLKIESSENDRALLDELYDYAWIINSGLYSQTEIDSVKSRYYNYRTLLIKKYPLLKEIFSENTAYSITEIQNKLSKDEYLISYYFTEKELYVALLGRREFKPFLLDVTKQQLFNNLAKVSPYFSKERNNVFFNQDLFSFNSGHSYFLYKEILEPVVNGLPVNSKIIFSLSQELVTIPLEFLVTKYDDSVSPYNFSNSHFLINDYQISYTPSVKLYINEKENDLKNNGKILIVGNPSINNQAKGFSERRGIIEEGQGQQGNFILLPLKYSEDEVNEINSLIRTDNILLRNDATETKFKLNAEYSKIIHLSAHSFLLDKQPVIFLSNYADSYNDGLLESGEIVKMKLNSDLVVLSSCNSGLGEVDKSEGIIGMAKAFYEAGVKSVIVSLWPVNDKYTSKLMALFYENLANGMNKSEALRNAKITFIEKYSPNPYYWSAFVLSGNTSNIDLEKKPELTPILIFMTGIILISLFAIYIKKKTVLSEVTSVK